jgi:DinB superfamily
MSNTTTVQVQPHWPKRLITDLSNSEQSFTALALGLSEPQLNWQPDASSWSIGQILDHLRITNESYLPPISTALSNAPHSPVDEIHPGLLAAFFLRKFVEPSADTRAVPAPGKIKPHSHVGTEVLALFLSVNESTRHLIIRARDANVNRLRFWNPLVPGIRFTVGTGLQIIASHERRHLLQAERVKNSLNFPAN